MPVQKKGGGERRQRLGVMSKGQEGAPPPFYLREGGAPGEGSPSRTPLLGPTVGRGEESSSPTNPCLAPQGFLDPFLVFKQTPRTLLEPSRTFRNLLESPYKHSGTFPNLENDPQYMNLILRTIPDLLVMSRIQSETPNNIRSPTHIPYLLKPHRYLSVSPYGL